MNQKIVSFFFQLFVDVYLILFPVLSSGNFWVSSPWFLNSTARLFISFPFNADLEIPGGSLGSLFLGTHFLYVFAHSPS